MGKIKIDLKDTQTIEYKGKLYQVTIKEIPQEKCICGCGKTRATSKSQYATNSCRTRVYRRNKLL